MSKLKLIIIGLGRHGKDTASEFLRDEMNYNFCSSSWFVAEKAVYPLLKRKYNYSTLQECYDDRHEHRADWFNIICEYNNPNPAKLGTELFKEHDIYCGLRNVAEFEAMKKNGVFDYCIWVDAFDRLGQTEDKSSITLSKSDADFVVYNNDSLESFKEEILSLIKKLEQEKNNAAS